MIVTLYYQQSCICNTNVFGSNFGNLRAIGSDRKFCLRYIFYADFWFPEEIFVEIDTHFASKNFGSTSEIFVGSGLS